ncbi:MAG TPA: hypothetical protein PKE30_06470 [Niabella sp.]|nr:hypothetical protein [Niabella sp.]
MKKLIVLTILMVYGLASFGVSLNYFYCCGKLETVSLAIANAQEEADHCPMGDKSGCCENKTVNHKISVDQTAQSTLFYSFLQSAPAVLPVPFFLTRENTLFATLTAPAYKKPPPVLPDTDIVFLSVFRI